MILCIDKTDVSVGGVRSGGRYPPRKDIGRQEERVRRSNNKHITISDGA